MKTFSRLLLAALPVVAAIALSACTSAPDKAAADEDLPGHTTVALPAAAPAHNSTDVMYLQMMIAHHAQGLEMAGLASQRAVREDVKLLAAAIESTQREEVKIMENWLQGWGEKTTTSHDLTTHAAHGGMPATGTDEIATLRGATGADFETKFLSLLAGHQGAAVEMAALVTKDGVNPEARDLARRITESRTDQIAQMLALMNA